MVGPRVPSLIFITYRLYLLDLQTQLPCLCNPTPPRRPWLERWARVLQGEGEERFGNRGLQHGSLAGGGLQRG